MRKTWKRPLAFLLSALMFAGLFYGCNNGEDSGTGNTTTSNAGEGKLFTEPTEISITIADHASWPYKSDWKMWQYFQEATGATFDIQTIPGTDYSTKVTLMMSSPETLPDLLHTWEKAMVDEHAAAGAFVSYTDNMDKMQNFQAFWNTIPEEERQDYMAQRTSGDGKIYSAPSYGTQTITGLRTWMYRKDIFDKHGLEVPETFEELYQVCKQLKELYPESYPLCFRTGFGRIDEMGPSWKKDWAQNAYYDFDQEQWFYGAQDPVMKQMVEYFIKMQNEGLVPPDYLTMPAKSWEELMSTDRGFITLDYVVRIDFFNLPNRERNPDYNLTMMAPPKPDVPTGSQKLMKSNLDFYGYCVCNTGDEEGINNAFKLVDWMYTDEAAELLSWGKEGETYQIVDGKKEFILEEGETPQAKYGVGTYGLYQRLEPGANEASYTDEMVESCHKALEYLEPQANPTMWVPLTEDELERITTLKSELVSFMEENLSKFLLQQRPMSEWDAFQEDLKQMGVDEMLQIYDTAYKRVMENTK